MRGKLLFLGLLLPLAALGQVIIDDRDVLLNSGKTLQQAITDGDFTYGSAVDVNPAEAGTTTAGLQEALARCPGSPAGSCILQLRANTTYTFPARNLWDSEHGFETGGGDNIWLRGYGDSSVISFQNTHPGETPGATLFDEIVYVGPGSANIRISDLKFVRDDTCTTNCTTGYGMAINVQGSVEDVTVENVTFISTQAATTDSTAPNAFGVRTLSYPDETPANIPRRIRVIGNRFQVATSAAIHALICNNCEFSDNQIRFVIPEDTTPTGTIRGMTLFGGTGNVVANNVVDLSTDGLLNTRSHSCFILQMDQTVHGAPETAQARINEGYVLSGNTCKGLRHTAHFGVSMQAYNHATITGNAFAGGMCSADNTKSCTNWQDCGSGQTCDASDARGIFFNNAAGTTVLAGADFNNYNTIAGNSFRGFKDTSSSGALFFDYHSSVPTAGTRNTFVGNSFGLNDPNADGISGTVATMTPNLFLGNLVSGARSDSTRCLGGSTTGTNVCALPIVSDGQNATQGFIKPAKFGFSNNTAFWSTPATGEIMAITDDPYPGACTSAGGSAHSICRYNGSAWLPLGLQVVRAGTAALGVALIAPGACAAEVTVAATGVLTSDVIQWTPNADISGITGYTPVSTGALSIYPYPIADNVRFKVCNPTSGNITPGAVVTLNWRVER